MPVIKPISDLRNYNQVLEKVSVGSPVYLTKNGHGCYTIMTSMKHENVFFWLTNQKFANYLRRNSRMASHWSRLLLPIVTAKSKSSLASVKVKTIMTNVMP